MSEKKYYVVSFPDLERIVLEAIVYEREKRGYSETWLRAKFNQIIKEGEKQK